MKERTPTVAAATMQPYFLALSLIEVPVKLSMGLVRDDSSIWLWQLLALIAAVLVGSLLSVFLRRFIHPPTARTFAIGVAFAGSIHVLGQGVRVLP